MSSSIMQAQRFRIKTYTHIHIHTSSRQLLSTQSCRWRSNPLEHLSIKIIAVISILKTANKHTNMISIFYRLLTSVEKSFEICISSEKHCKCVFHEKKQKSLMGLKTTKGRVNHEINFNLRVFQETSIKNVLFTVVQNRKFKTVKYTEDCLQQYITNRCWLIVRTRQYSQYFFSSSPAFIFFCTQNGAQWPRLLGIPDVC